MLKCSRQKTNAGDLQVFARPAALTDRWHRVIKTATHLVKDGDLPQSHADCTFILSRSHCSLRNIPKIWPRKNVSELIFLWIKLKTKRQGTAERFPRCRRMAPANWASHLDFGVISKLAGEGEKNALKVFKPWYELEVRCCTASLCTSAPAEARRAHWVTECRFCCEESHARER